MDIIEDHLVIEGRIETHRGEMGYGFKTPIIIHTS